MSRASGGNTGSGRARFAILPIIPYPIRVVLIAAPIAAGFYFQLTGSLVIGFVLIAAGSLFGSVRSVKYKPKGLGGEIEWTEVLPDQWDQAELLIKKGKRWQRDVTNMMSVPGTIVLIAIGVITCFTFALTVDYDPELTFVLIGDATALFGPIFFIGMLSAWKPPDLGVKLKALKNILWWLEEAAYPDLNPQPMMGFSKGGGDEGPGMVPLDARLMLRFKAAPENFYGVQVQVSINNVQGRPFPYLYAVILFKSDFPVGMDAVQVPRGRKLVFEPSLEKDVVVQVLRQATTKTSGYFTNPSRQIEIVGAALDLAGEILRSAS